MKVQISVPDGLLERIDSYCKQNRYTRSGFISLCVGQYLDAKEASPELNQQFSDALQTMGDFLLKKISAEEMSSRLDASASRIKELSDGIEKE